MSNSATNRDRDVFGCSKLTLDQNKHFVGAGIHFHIKGGDGGAPGPVHALASSTNYLVGISMTAGHKRRIRHEHHHESYDFADKDLYIRTLDDNYRAELTGNFDFVLIEIEPSVLSRFADEANVEGLSELTRTIGRNDPVLGGLVAALKLSHGSDLIKESLGAAIGNHLIGTYGVVSRRRRVARGGLSRRNLNLAKELILARLDLGISVGSLADECNMSRSAFARAFKESTGKTPWQWITEARLERSQILLINQELSLEDIAASCGFADHSHFTRVFAAHRGEPPSTWRRKMI
ncbi:helix-turn-helix domain-containing protein [Oryzifoliimicrobium ureilyticus]|uniref:helix-turn-helix domain-containing protein n=1 Tax=Oryzifoliimicrobium ureilyticus TaxID=3113724 RepID=UPI003075F92E